MGALAPGAIRLGLLPETRDEYRDNPAGCLSATPTCSLSVEEAKGLEEGRTVSLRARRTRGRANAVSDLDELMPPPPPPPPTLLLRRGRVSTIITLLFEGIVAESRFPRGWGHLNSPLSRVCESELAPVVLSAVGRRPGLPPLLLRPLLPELLLLPASSKPLPLLIVSPIPIIPVRLTPPAAALLVVASRERARP